MKILPVYYFPPVSWFAAALQAGEVILEQHEFYKKQNYFNRMNILTHNGVLKLSIPVAKAKERTPIKDRQIWEDGKWRKDHWRSLEAAYRSSPYFEYYEDLIEPFYSGEWTSLMDFNLEILKLLINALGLDIKWSLSTSFEDSEHYEADFRTDFDTRLAASPAWFRPVSYQQVFGTEFVPDLSILDLLFNCGPESVRILRESYHAGQ
jgi:hypothetical protein